MNNSGYFFGKLIIIYKKPRKLLSFIFLLIIIFYKSDAIAQIESYSEDFDKITLDKIYRLTIVSEPVKLDQIIGSLKTISKYQMRLSLLKIGKSPWKIELTGFEVQQFGPEKPVSFFECQRKDVKMCWWKARLLPGSGATEFGLHSKDMNKLEIIHPNNLINKIQDVKYLAIDVKFNTDLASLIPLNAQFIFWPNCKPNDNRCLNETKIPKGLHI